MKNLRISNVPRINNLLVLLTVAISIAAVTNTATAKSLYILTDMDADPQPLQAYDIGVDGTLTFQTEHYIPRIELGAVGLAADADNGYLFITYEESPEIYIVDGKTMTAVGSIIATDAANLAGIVYDHEKELLYCVDRCESWLYVYQWDAINVRLEEVNGSPFALRRATAYGIALDEINDVLYVANGTNQIYAYSTFNWSLTKTITVSRIAISVAIDVKNGFLYSGGGYLDNHYLTQYHLATNTEKEVMVEPDAGVIGLGVDTETGLVYMSTGNDTIPGGDNLLIYNISLQQVGKIPSIGNKPTGLAIPGKDMGYNPLNLTKRATEGVVGTNDLNEIQSVSAGSLITYTISFDNLDNDYTITDLVIVDILPREVSFVSADGEVIFGEYDPITHTYTWFYPSLSKGTSACINLTVRVNEDVEPGTSFTNFVTINSNQTPPTTTGVSVSVSYNPLFIKKSVLGAFADEVKTVAPGDEVTYRIHFHNNDNDNDFTATGVTIVDILPQELSFVNADYDWSLGHYDADTHTYIWRYPPMQPGDATQVKLVARVNSDVLPGSMITNTAIIDSEQTPEATSSVDVIAAGTGPVNRLNLRKTIVGNVDRVGLGEEVTYRICFDGNDISQAVTNVSVIDLLPQDLSFVKADGDGIIGQYNDKTHTYTWSYPYISPGEVVKLEMTAKVNQDAALGKTITNLITISSDETPPVMASVDILTDEGGWMIEGLQIIPDMIRRNDAITDITAVLIFPEGIRMGDIGEEPLVLFPGEIEASEQNIEEIDGKVKITAVFDENALWDNITGYGQVNVGIVGKFTSGQSFYGQATITIIKAEDISDYISGIYIEQIWDHGDPSDDTDLMYEFRLEIEAWANYFFTPFNIDAFVEDIEFMTPAGNLFTIPKLPGQWTDDIWRSYEYDPEWGMARWEYRARFEEIADLQAYGDGEYTITLHYKNGGQSQTTAWFGMPDTEESIPQPTQEPVLTFPSHHQKVQSPVTFTWEPCTDTNVTEIWIDVDELGTIWLGDKWEDFDVSETSWGPVYIPDGIWEAEIVFDRWMSTITNTDGIWTSAAKYSKGRYRFTIEGCPWTKYEVWGGDIWIDWRDGSYGSIADLEANGYVKLGQSDGQAATFSGQYQYYVIATVGEFLLDSIQGSDGSYYSSFEANCSRGNIFNEDYMLGPPDGRCAIVGTNSTWDDYSGDLVFTNPGNWEGLTVITSDLNLNISKDIENSTEKLENIDPNDTITFIIHVDSNDFTNEVTDVTIVDILPDEVSFVSADSNEVSGEYDPDTHTYTWFLESLPPESSLEMQLIAQVNPNVAPGTTIANFVTINSNETPPTTAVATITTANLLEVNDVQISTSSISTGDTLTNITFIIELPEGIGIDDIADEPLELYPGNIISSEHFIEEIDGIVKISAVFDKDALLDAVPDYYGPLDLTVKGTLTSGQSFYGEATITIIKAEDISDHIFLIYFEQIWDYGNPTDNNDLMYEFFLEIGAGGKQGLNMDANVASIEFRTPAGNTFQIPKQPGQWSDDKWTSYEYTPYEWGGDATWEYRTRVADVADLQAYGDGEYIITVHYKSGNQSQTTAWFGISDTNKPIGQPTQEPALTFPLYNQTIESPSMLTWEPCTDTNTMEIDIWMREQRISAETFSFSFFDANETSWQPVYLKDGFWEVVFAFCNYQPSWSLNNDGIYVDVAKYSISKYKFTIANSPLTTYEVWGGDVLLEPYWYVEDLEANGYIKLGESDGQTAAFSGQYRYYLIGTIGQLLLDSIQGSDGSYYSSFDPNYITGGIILEEDSMLGPPDGLCASIGTNPWIMQGFTSHILFSNPGNWEGLTVITRNLNIGKSIMNPIEDIENIGPNDTITYNICFDSNDLVDSVTDVTVVDFLPDEVSFVSADGNEFLGEYDPDTHTYTWFSESLSPESTIEMQLKVQVNPDVTLGTNITNFATINSNETPPTTASANIVYNRVVGDLQIVPDTIRRNGTITGIMAVLKLPEGIYENIDTNEPLVLSPVDQDEIKIRANDNPIVTETDGRTTVIAVFDKAEVMDTIPDYGEVGVKIIGKFTSGYTFYGETTITITRFAGN